MDKQSKPKAVPNLETPLQNAQTPVVYPDALPDLYRAGMYAELQKFGRDEGEIRQLLRSSHLHLEAEIIEDWTITAGLDLGVNENKALSALQILLHKTSYQGNHASERITSSQWRHLRTTPKVSTTFSEYLEAYGIPKRGGRYRGKQVDDALKALDGLTQTRRIVYKRTRWTGEGKDRKQVSDIVVAEQPLIIKWSFYEGLEGEEVAKVESGQHIPRRAKGIIITVCPLLIDCIEDFYLLKPVNLYKEILDVCGKRRVPRAILLFIEWLLTKNSKTVQVSKETLIVKLRLTKMVEHRRKSRLDQTLTQCYEVAKTLGYLLSYKEAVDGLIKFTLNPERCKRVASLEKVGKTA